MADQLDNQATVQPVAVASSLRDQVATIKRALIGSPVRKWLLWTSLGIMGVIIATSIGQVLLNRWNQPFYDALARRDMAAFLHQLMVFAMIAGGLLVLNIGQTWLNQMIRLKLREALTLDLIDQWMRPARAFRLANAGAIGVNPDQRMQQDAAHLSDLSTDLGVGLLQSFILLVSFVGVLWELSSGFVFHVNGWPPILVASPVYFSGDISFGGLMMAVGAFNQVHSSLRWFINNIGSIADWRATLMRVADFRIALDETDVLHDKEKRIEFADNANGSLTFEKLQVASPDGCTKLADQHVEILAGERVMITGEPGAGKTLFFRAIAGLWPWGSGRIGLPAGETIIFVPRVPYLPAGTLREVLNHPNGHAPANDADISAVLAEVGLGRLSSSLDRVGRWDHELGDDEQRLLGVARLALRQPKWVIIDEAMDAFDGPSLRRVLSLLEKRLPGAAILNIGRGQHNNQFFPRSLTIVKDSGAPSLKPAHVRAGAIEPPPAAASLHHRK
ncbi:ABC transporter ATP-binding protein/permease [Mesorhizobium australicum]|uniref:ABC transporter ATP-binding protein/permease n=1 Tax=Mesorhizobium australicum TaxID=536018 RepID=UPI00333924CF